MVSRGVSYQSTTIPITDFSYKVGRNLFSEKSVSSPAESSIFGGGYSVSGTFSGSYRPDAMKEIVRAILCTANISSGGIGNFVTSRGVDDSGFTHTITLSDEFGHAFSFGSAAVTSMELSMKAGGIATATFNWIGARELSPGNVSPADFTEDVPVFYNATITAGGVIVYLNDFTLTINRPIDASGFIIGSEYTHDMIQSDSVTIEGSFTLDSSEWAMISTTVNTTDSEKYVASSSNRNASLFGEILITFKSPDASTTMQTITITNAYCSDANVSVSGRQRFNKTITFRASATLTGGILFSTPSS